MTMMFTRRWKQLLIPTIVCCFGFSSLALAQENSSSAPNDEPHRSSGGLFVEPLLLYTQEDSSIKTSQLPLVPSDTSGTSRAGGIGARLGFHLGEVVFLAADGRYSRTSISDSSYGDAEGNSYNIGPVLGIQMPYAGLRVWGTYVMAGEYDPEAGRNGFDVKFKDPRGARVGVGFHIGSVSLNLEYEDLKFDTTDIQSFGVVPGSASSSVDYESKGYTASLSFPIEL